MVPGKGPKRKETRNILTRMEDAFKGPLNGLTQFVNENKRVKVGLSK